MTKPMTAGYLMNYGSILSLSFIAPQMIYNPITAMGFSEMKAAGQH